MTGGAVHDHALLFIPCACGCRTIRLIVEPGRKGKLARGRVVAPKRGGIGAAGYLETGLPPTHSDPTQYWHIPWPSHFRRLAYLPCRPPLHSRMLRSARFQMHSKPNR